MGGANNTPEWWPELHTKIYGIPPVQKPPTFAPAPPVKAPSPETVSAPATVPSAPAVASASPAKNATTEPVAAKGYSTPQAAIFPTMTVPQSIAPQPPVAPISKINQLTQPNQVSSFKLPDTSNLRFGGS